MLEVTPTQEAREFDAYEWLTEALAKRAERRASADLRKKVRYRASSNDNHEVPVRESFVLRYVPREPIGRDNEGFEMSIEVPLRTSVVIYGPYESVSPGRPVLAVFCGNVALKTLKKGRGFCDPEPINRPVRNRPARAA